MKKFIKNNFIILCLSLTAIVGCTKEEEELGTDVDSTAFFDVVYQTAATRETANVGWTPVTGIMQMKVVQSTATEGTFIIFYRTYHETQFNFPVCSGGYKGNFVIPTSSSTSPTDGNYDVNTPYNGGTSTTTTGTQGVDANGNTIEEILPYTFNLSITSRNLDANCRPESNRTVQIARFSNGEIILKSEYRQLLMKPVLTSDPSFNQ